MIDSILSRLDKVRPSTAGARRWMARCPSHEDRSASLSIRETDDGRILLHCFAECGAVEVLGALGLTLGDLFPDGAKGERLPRTRANLAAVDVVRALEVDLLLIAVCSAQLSRGEALSSRARARLLECSKRIARGVEASR